MKKKTMTTLAALTLGFVMNQMAGASAMAATGQSNVPCAGVGADSKDKPGNEKAVAGSEEKSTPTAQSAKDKK